MDLNKFFEILAGCGDGDVIEIPGPVKLATNEADGAAGRILQKLSEEWIKDDTTLGETEEVLMYNALQAMEKTSGQGWYSDEVRAWLYAWWWIVWWGSMTYVKKGEDERDHVDA